MSQQPRRRSLIRTLKRRLLWRQIQQLRRHPASGPEKKYPLAICAIFKNEAPYLREWIEFHRLQGATQFYLYDNRSDDNSLEVLRPYVEAGIATVTFWPLHPAQQEAYDHCLALHQNSARWIAFLDVDEYAYSTGDETLLEALSDYDEYSAVAINWIMFNTSGHILKPGGLTIENYTRCQIEGNHHVKVVVNPAKTLRMLTPHHAAYSEGQAVDENKRPVSEPFNEPPTLNRLRVNHYWTRSVEEWFLHRLRRGQADGVLTFRDPEGLLMAEREYSTGEDKAILRFVAALKNRLEKQP